MILMLLIFTFIYGVLLVRFFFCQVVEGPSLARLSGNLRDRSIFLPESVRGDILDRNGISMTNQGLGWACVLIPKQFMQTSLNIARLASLLQTDTAEIYRKLQVAAKRCDQLVMLKSGCDLNNSLKQELNNMHGVEIVSLSRRYEADGLMTHIIGTIDDTSDSGGVPQGSSGLEMRFDKYLSRQVPRQAISVAMDGKKEILDGLSPQIKDNSTDPRRTNVVTTIDRQVQEIVEGAMDAKVSSGAIVVLDVYSRDILAIGSRPTFNCYGNSVQGYKSQQASHLNRALTAFYPGSLFKVAVAAAALDNGIIKPSDIFLCDGAYYFPSSLRIPCWKSAGHGWVSINRALAESCNDAFIQIGSKTGRDILLKKCRAMHLVDPRIIGYDHSQTNSHIVIDYGGAALANASVGQNGVMMTPLQGANMIATVVDHGVFKQPRLVMGVRRGENYVQTFPSDAGERVIDQKTSQEITEALRLVTKEGTGTQAYVPKWGSGGKTATAQTGQIGTDGNEILNTWFVGFFPENQPRWVIAVMVEKGRSGGHDAAPVFKDVAQKIGKLLI